jgi:uncharacterized membrane protein YecN with MAPEG domain
MPFLPVTSVWIAVFAIALFLLSFPVALHRKRSRTSLGDGGDAALQRRVRAQGNFTEYVPMALLVIGAVEAAGYDTLFVWSLGGLMSVGRFLHAWGILGGTLPPRAAGMIATFLVLTVGAALVLWRFAQSA